MSEHEESPVILTWADVSTALDVLLDLSRHTIDLVDRDLALQGWETAVRGARVEAAIARGVCLRICVADLRHFEQHLARLARLINHHCERLHVVECAQPEAITQCVVVVDGQHGLVRPDATRSRGRSWKKDSHKTMVYENFFNEVWRLSGRRYFSEAHGL